MQTTASYEEFKQIWLEDVLAGDPDNLSKGRRFSSKLVCQWLDLDEDDVAIHMCDGSGDGGIDIAVLDSEGKIEDGDDQLSFDRWLLVQSKFGSAFAGPRTILDEGRKVLDTLRGHNSRLSSLSSDIYARIMQFKKDVGPNDKIVLVYATLDEIPSEDRKFVKIIESEGKKHLGDLFEVETVSLNTIFERYINANRIVARIKIESRMRGFATISSVKIINYFTFLEQYQKQTNDIDRLFERNIRKFLHRSKINQRLRETLQNSPNKFAIYNNGVTIVCSSTYQSGTGYQHALVNPFVVNGCQTTKTIWDVCNSKSRSGGRNPSEDTTKWRIELGEAEIPIKIVKVKADDLDTLREITRYTNTQNAIRERDFLALFDDFRKWAIELEEKHGIFLEIQRGAWEARVARQRNNPSMRQLKEAAAASDLLKVIGACWFRYPGAAFSKNEPFLPGGSIYKEMNPPNSLDTISADDLFAAYKLQQAAKDREFGRSALKSSRKSTKFLFYFIAGELCRRLLRTREDSEKPALLTKLLLCIVGDGHFSKPFFDGVANVVDRYLDQSRGKSIFREEAFNQNLNTFLKSDTFGRDISKVPNLNYHIDIQENTWMDRGFWEELLAAYNSCS